MEEARRLRNAPSGGDHARLHTRLLDWGMVTEKDVRRALRKVKDPELNLDLVVLGLVYEIDVQETHVNVKMSLTSPFCPVSGQILEEAKAAVEGVEGVESANVELTFSPAWTPERIDPLIRATLGL